MSNRRHRIHDKRRAEHRNRLEPERALRDYSRHGFDCGCTHLARMDYHATCASCGHTQHDQILMPSSTPVGGQVEITTSCPCGAEAHGTATVIEIV